MGSQTDASLSNQFAEALPAPDERGCSANQSRRLERDGEKVGASLTVLETFSDDPKRKSLHLRHSQFLAGAIAEDAWPLQDFGQPAAVVFTLSLDLVGDHGPVATLC